MAASCDLQRGSTARKFRWIPSIEKKSVIVYTGSEKRIQTRMDSLFAELVLNHEFNGSVLIARRGRVLYKKVFGYQTKKPARFLTDSSAFQLASTSKPFTATAILMLYEWGKLQLDDSVQKFIPGFPYKGITVKMLLNHRSGLPNYMYCMDDTCKAKDVPLTNEQVIGYMIKTKPGNYSAPDKKFEYCNTNYMLLATIVEKVSGMSFADFMKKNIFLPLGMKHTRVVSMASDTLQPNDTRGYEGKEIEPVEADFLDGTVGDKGIYSTTYDLFRFERALTKGRVLKPQTLELAYAGYSFEKKGNRNYGLGWRILQRKDEPMLIYHNGWWHGYTTAFIRRPQDETVIIVLCNRFRKGSFYSHYILNIMDGRPANGIAEEEE